MKVRQLAVASAELRAALAWYRERSRRAAENLWLRVQDARRSILLFPHAPHCWDVARGGSSCPAFPTI